MNLPIIDCFGSALRSFAKRHFISRIRIKNTVLIYELMILMILPNINSQIGKELRNCLNLRTFGTHNFAKHHFIDQIGTKKPVLSYELTVLIILPNINSQI
jgi:hypothetical protein